MRSWSSGDKELTSVGVRARVGHAQHPGACVLVLKVLVGKLGAVDALAARAVVVGKVAALLKRVTCAPMSKCYIKVLPAA